MASVGRNAGYNLVGSALPLLLSLVTIPLYLHLIGPERYGVLAISWLLLGYFGLFDLGLGRATAYHIAAAREAPAKERAEVFWTATLINPLVGLVGGLLLLGGASWYFANLFEVDEALRPEILRSVPLLALAVPVATLTGTLTGTLQGRERFGRLNLVSASSTALFQLLPLGAAAAFGPDLPMLIGLAVIARLIGCAWLGWLGWNDVARGFPATVSRQRFRELLGYGGWAAVSSLVGPLLLISDRFVIGAAFGAVAVALYAVPFQLIQRVMIVPNAVNSALMPRLAAADREKRSRLGEVGQGALEALLTPACVVAIFAAEPALSLWVGPTLGPQMAPLARIMIVHVWLFALSAVKITLNYADGRPQAVTRAYLIELPLYFGFLIAAIHWWGLVGATLALAFRSAMDLLVQGWSYDSSLPRPRIWAELLLLGAAVAIASLELSMALRFAGAVALLGAALWLARSAVSPEIWRTVAAAFERGTRRRATP